jgi:predicted nucleotidyltransferase/HEPN domain-containing protein
MKTSIDHLPAHKQEELRAIVEILRAGAPVEMLILFGSHARGDWVEDPEEGYFSDWDLLVVVERPKVAEDAVLWSRLGTEANAACKEAAVALIAHDIKFVNREIRCGSYFFGDILREGVMLYNAGGLALATPKEATPTERVERAERNFLYWFESANGFLRLFDMAVRDGESLYKHAAFLLHQATERLYVTAALVFTGYKRKRHDLKKLDDDIAPLHPELSGALPRTDPEDARLFDLLRRGYIDARYVKSYRVTAEELSALGERVRRFAAVVERVCREKIESLRAAAEAART